MKIMLFFIVLAMVAIGGYWFYRKLNQKIIASETITAVLFYSILLIAANGLLLFGGTFILISVYDLLSAS